MSTGVAALARMARQTSTPERPGIMRSVTTRSGVQSLKTCRPSSGSFAVLTSYPCAESAARSTRVICGSSSITRILPGMPFFFQQEITSSGWGGIMHGGRKLSMVSDSRGAVHWLVGTMMAALTTAALVWLGANSTAAGMVFLVLVVWSSTQAGLWLALYIAVVCA